MVATGGRAPSAPSTVAHTAIDTQIGPLHLYATEHGLLAIVLPNHDPARVDAWVHRVTGAADIAVAPARFEAPVSQIRDYLAGKRRGFDLALDVRGTDFQREVWREVAAVPYGQTAAYATIASRVGRSTAVRAVGAANGSNPLPIVIPCHRIVGSDGSLTGYGGGLPLKRRLLDLERAP